MLVTDPPAWVALMALGVALYPWPVHVYSGRTLVSLLDTLTSSPRLVTWKAYLAQAIDFLRGWGT